MGEMGMGSELEDYMGGLDMEDYLGDFEGFGSEMDDYFEGSEIGGDYADYVNRQMRTDEEPEVEIDYAEYGDYAEDDYDDYDEDLDEYDEEYKDEYDEEDEEYEYIERILPEERADVNDCKGKADGDKCTKKCRGPSCKNAKCWKDTCLTGRKYKIVAGAGRMQSKAPQGEYNNCTGKKDGDSCKKRCNSKSCK